LILLDTSILIDALTGSKRSAASLRSAIVHGERIIIPSLVLYEWLRGPRGKAELAAQEALFPSETAVSFGPKEALAAARLYGKLHRPRGREIDIAIAACAICHDCDLWTLNRADFEDIPDLRLFSPDKPGAD
jgi:predicted nucleic acid-binding protein